MNNVVILLNAHLKKYSLEGNSKIKYELNKDNILVGDILKEIGIYGEIGIILLNDKIVNDNTLVKFGDKIEVYPIIDGG